MHRYKDKDNHRINSIRTPATPASSGFFSSKLDINEKNSDGEYKGILSKNDDVGNSFSSTAYKDEKIVASDDKGQKFSAEDENSEDLAGDCFIDNDEADMIFANIDDEAEDSGGKFCVDDREKGNNFAAIDDKTEDFGGTDDSGERFADEDKNGKNFPANDDNKPDWFAGSEDMCEFFADKNASGEFFVMVQDVILQVHDLLFLPHPISTY